MAGDRELNEFKVRVAGRREPAARIVELELAPVESDTLPAWEAGAHIEVILRPDLVRHYSLCGDVRRADSWRIAVLLADRGRGGSAAVHDELSIGSTVTVRGPRNRFALVPSVAYLFLAGGIGITPILPMLAQAETAGSKWRLVYGGRTADSMAYAAWLTDTYGDKVQLCPQDVSGDLDLAGLFGSLDGDTVVYCCGPEGLLRAAEQHAEQVGAELHTERFVAGQIDDSTVNEAFTVNLLDSGMSVDVGADETALEAIERAGVFALSSCREGVCGTCETRVAAGRIDHRDTYLNEDEHAAGDVMMICVSRSAGGPLDLEL